MPEFNNFKIGSLEFVNNIWTLQEEAYEVIYNTGFASRDSCKIINYNKDGSVWVQRKDGSILETFLHKDPKVLGVREIFNDSIYPELSERLKVMIKDS